MNNKVFKRVKNNIFEISDNKSIMDIIEKSFPSNMLHTVKKTDMLLTLQGSIAGAITRLEFKKTKHDTIVYKYYIGVVRGTDELRDFMGYDHKHGAFTIGPSGNMQNALEHIHTNMMNFVVTMVRDKEYMDWKRMAQLYHSDPELN